MTTLLVPIDFSRVTKSVTRAACDLARLTGGRIVLLHVVQPLTAFESYGLGPEFILSSNAASEKSAVRHLNRLAQACTRHIKAVRTILHTGVPARVIAQKAAAIGADYIVIGSHGHGAVFDLLVGSTTQKVLRRPPCPVFVVPAPKARGKR
jgi:nucleotide-binding universal stress UspA family protein